MANQTGLSVALPSPASMGEWDVGLVVKATNFSRCELISLFSLFLKIRFKGILFLSLSSFPPSLGIITWHYSELKLFFTGHANYSLLGMQIIPYWELKLFFTGHAQRSGERS